MKKFNIKNWKKECKEYEKWTKKHPILSWIYPKIYRFPDLPREIKLSTVSFIQRGKRGWSNRDTWGLCNYLATIITQSIKHLKKNINGRPCGLTEGQWIDILNMIIDTFDTVTMIMDDKLYLIKDDKKRREWNKHLQELNKTFKNNARCMTDKEIKNYEKGWKLFKEYFFNLWD